MCRPRAAITAQAKPERPHARVADPSRVDGVRPWAGPRISADGSGVVAVFAGGRVPKAFAECPSDQVALEPVQCIELTDAEASERRAAVLR
jgi:hypothetical protein